MNEYDGVCLIWDYLDAWLTNTCEMPDIVRKYKSCSNITEDMLYYMQDGGSDSTELILNAKNEIKKEL